MAHPPARGASRRTGGGTATAVEGAATTIAPGWRRSRRCPPGPSTAAGRNATRRGAGGGSGCRRRRLKVLASARARIAVALSCVLVATGAGCSTAAHRGSHATGLESLERSVQEFTLGNGVRFLLVERHDSPVFSLETVVDAGSADDTPGATGLAHMMEHMAFKGTPWVGVRDAAAEVPLLRAEEDAYLALAAERGRGEHADSTRVRQLAATFATAQAAAERLVEPEEFSRILERAGARDVNAE